MKKFIIMIIVFVLFMFGLSLFFDVLQQASEPAKIVEDVKVEESDTVKKVTQTSTKIVDRCYNNRYNKEPIKVPIFYHGGGERIDNNKHKDNIRAVISHLDFVPDDENIVALVFETGIAETHGGYWVKSTYNNADMGVYQINKYTYNDLMKWLKRHKLDKQIMKFYDRKQSLQFNLIHNVAFNASLCVAHYYRYYGDDLAKAACNVNNRAKMWKERYNTRLGKGTVEAYLERVEIYG